MLNIIRKIQQRAASIESKYSANAEWLNAAHGSYLAATAHQWCPNIRRDETDHQCALPANPCLALECQGPDSREQDHRDIMKMLSFDGAHDIMTPEYKEIKL